MDRMRRIGAAKRTNLLSNLKTSLDSITTHLRIAELVVL